MSGSDSDQQPDRVSFERQRGVQSILVTRHVAHAVISVGDDALRSSRIIQVYRVLSEADVPIFLNKMHRTAVALAMAGADVEKAQAALKAAGLKTTLRRDLAVVAIRATSMRDLSGVMVTIGDVLYQAGARLYAIGDSHNSVQCLIEGERVAEATRLLCETFRLGPKCVQEATLATEDAA